jgi:hypothetical protein
VATTVPFPLTTLDVGSHDFGPAPVADTTTSATLVIDRTPASGFNSQPSTTQASIQVMQSNDGGVTWKLEAAADIEGGIITDRHGNTLTQSSVTVGLDPGTSRQMKATVVVSGAAVAVSGSLTIS